MLKKSLDFRFPGGGKQRGVYDTTYVYKASIIWVLHSHLIVDDAIFIEVWCCASKRILVTVNCKLRAQRPFGDAVTCAV